MRLAEADPISFNTSEDDFLLEDEVDRDLSLRELEVLALVARDLSNKEIARELGISMQTAKNHVTSILRRMNVDSRMEVAVVFQHTFLAINFENPNFTLAEFQDRLFQTAQNKEAWVFGLAQSAQERFSPDEQLIKARASVLEKAGGGEGQRLTKRELEVLGLVSQGLFNKEIARRLEISKNTVENHISSILRKLNVYDRTGLALVFQRAIFSCLMERLHFTPEEFQDRLFQTVQEDSWRFSEERSRLEELIKEGIEAKNQRHQQLRERPGQIVQQLAEGRSIKEIAASLGDSFRAIENAIYRLYKEFGIDTHDPHRRELLVEEARKTGFLD